MENLEQKKEFILQFVQMGITTCEIYPLRSIVTTVS